MRIDKFLSNLKFGSRKEVRNLLKDEEVLVNGQIVHDPATIIKPSIDEITVYGEVVFYKDSLTLMMNKPVDVVSANTDTLHETVIDILPVKYQPFDFKIAGRLDKDSSGLLILTTDGRLMHQIISPNKEVYKTYLVKLTEPVRDIAPLLEGIVIKDGKNEDFLTKPAIIEVLDPTSALVKITEGKFHQVKRMFEFIGNEVLSLKRIKIGELALDEALQPGCVKELSEQDILKLFL